jgi:hypothetical protein
VRQLSSAPDPSLGTTSPRWRDLYTRGRLTQRRLVSESEMRTLGTERGLPLRLGREVWEQFDAAGAFCPIAFGLGGWHDEFPLDADQSDTVVFREERPYVSWEKYSVDHWGHPSTHPLYSPWQTLALQSTITEQTFALPVPTLLDSNALSLALEGPFKGVLENQLATWRGLNDWWAPTIKLLVEIQNRFWPDVSGRVVMPIDPARNERVDPMPAERAEFDPLAVLHRHGLDEQALAQAYGFLLERGARSEGGRDGRSSGGDRWARLRQMAHRQERARILGPARMAMDFYEAAEMLGLLWHDITGTFLPAIDVVPYRRTTRPIDHDVVRLDPYSRSRAALREKLVERGLWPGRVHAVVEGETEVMWVEQLVTAFLGGVPESLLITNLRGVGAARQVGAIIALLEDATTHAALLVDNEGEMGRVVPDLIRRGVLSPEQVLMVGDSFEESNFSAAELLRVVRLLARNPPGDRPKIHVDINVRQLGSRQSELIAAARAGSEPGLAATLLKMLREPEHGSLNLSKTELAQGLIDFTLAEIEACIGNSAKIEKLMADRPAVRFIAEQLANPLGDLLFR